MSQKQLNETLQDEDNLTLYTDETTKFGTKYSGYHVSDSAGQLYVMGMRQILTKSGKDTLSAFEELLEDIDERSEAANMVAKKVLLNITSTMSDRESTEKKFNQLLEELRSSVLQELYENWKDLSQEDQTKASTLLNFCCGLHSLIHFAETSNSTCREAEKLFFLMRIHRYMIGHSERDMNLVHQD